MSEYNYFEEKNRKLKADADAAAAAAAKPKPEVNAPPLPSGTSGAPASITPDDINVLPDVNPGVAGAALLGAGALAEKSYKPALKMYKPALKMAKNPAVKAVAGLGATLLGNEAVDYTAPRNARNTGLTEAGRGVGLTYSGAAGGYLARGPVGAVVGAVANPALDIYKSVQETQQSRANTANAQANINSLNQRYPDNTANKVKNALNRQKNQKAIQDGTYRPVGMEDK